MSLTVTKTSKNAHSWNISSNTGRNQKKFYSQVYIGSESEKKSQATVVFIQDGKPEFIELATDSIIKVPAIYDAYIQIRAISNSQLVKVTLEGDLTMRLMQAYINGDVYRPNNPIQGDPGSDSEYTFSINLDYPDNQTASERSARIILEDNAGHSVYCDVIQSGAVPAITVTPTSVEVPAAGGSGTIMVSSNDEWFVSTVENI